MTELEIHVVDLAAWYAGRVVRIRKLLDIKANYSLRPRLISFLEGAQQSRNLNAPQGDSVA